MIALKRKSPINTGNKLKLLSGLRKKAKLDTGSDSSSDHIESELAYSGSAISVDNVSKRYGLRPIIRDLNMDIKAGEVYALVGPNGAGKTTIIRLITGLAFPSSGKVNLLGVDPIRDPKVKKHLGAVVEAPAAFYPYMTGRQNLKLHAKLISNIGKERIGKERIAEVLDQVELSNAAERKVGVYSLGMRQRLGLAAAILAKPNILILDEPASGMDPLSLHLVHKVLQDSAKAGAAVFISTHHLDEVAEYCTKVGILEEGRLIDEVNLTQRRDRYRIVVDKKPEALAALKVAAFIKTVISEVDSIIIDLTSNDALAKVSTVLSKAGVNILELSPDIFDLRAYYRERMNTTTGQSNPHITSPDSETT